MNTRQNTEQSNTRTCPINICLHQQQSRPCEPSKQQPVDCSRCQSILGAVLDVHPQLSHTNAPVKPQAPRNASNNTPQHFQGSGTQTRCDRQATIPHPSKLCCGAMTSISPSRQALHAMPAGKVCTPASQSSRQRHSFVRHRQPPLPLPPQQQRMYKSRGGGRAYRQLLQEALTQQFIAPPTHAHCHHIPRHMSHHSPDPSPPEAGYPVQGNKTLR